MPIIIPPSAPTGLLRYEWVDPQEVVRDLSFETSPQLFVSRGAAGLGAPPVEIADEKLPWHGGTVVRHISTGAARMSLPITIRQETMGDLLQVFDDLRGWFDTGDEQRRSPGYLRITRQDDTVRQRLCYYAGGLEGNLDEGAPTWTTVVVDLYAPDGWPTDGETQTEEWDTSDFPNVALMNSGRRDAYPIWTITGPAQGVIIGNTTTDKVWGWGGIVPDGDTLLVDTRPASQRFTYPVTTGGGVSQYLYMTANSELWHLTPGLNAITLEIDAMTTGDTRIAVQYEQRFNGGLR
jgi:hypothetical protein